MFFKCKRKPKEVEPASDMSKEEYDRALQNINKLVECSEGIENKIAALEYALAVFRDEFAARTRSRIFRYEEHTTISGRFPHAYYSENYDQSVIKKQPNKKEIALDNRVAVSAWAFDRLSGILPVILHDGFIMDSSNHEVSYYPYLDLAIASNGLHSISAGVFQGSGSVQADVYDLTEVFDHIDTDGNNWIYRHMKKSFASVGDRYFALLYSIAQMKFFHEHASEDVR